MLVHPQQLDVADAKQTSEYDVFIASPMSPFSSSEYHANRESLISLLRGLKRTFGFSRFFCPAVTIESKATFASEYDSVAEDLAALAKSSFFVLHYINAVKSSALFEAGVAFSKGLPSIYIVRVQDDLPYLLRELERYSFEARNAPRVRIVTVDGDLALADAVDPDWFSFAGSRSRV